MTATRWLSTAEQGTWRAYLEATQLLTEALARELAEGTTLSSADYELFVRLSEAPGRRLRMSELADRTLASRSRLSHAVARLEAQGYVEREACDSDKRGQFAVLTDAGFAALEAAAPVHVESVRTHLFDQLDEEQLASLGTIMNTLRSHLRKVVDAPPCPGAAASAG